MGTRGLYIFVFKGIQYVFSNSMDSYPEALGQLLVLMLKMEDYEQWGSFIEDTIVNKKGRIRRLEYKYCKFVECDLKERDLEHFEPYEDDGIIFEPESEWQADFSTGEISVILLRWDFKCLIKNCEILKLVLNSGCPTMDISSYIGKFSDKDDIKDLLADWNYTINLDTMIFEVSSYNQKIQFPINNIPGNWISFI